MWSIIFPLWIFTPSPSSLGIWKWNMASEVVPQVIECERVEEVVLLSVIRRSGCMIGIGTPIIKAWHLFLDQKLWLVQLFYQITWVNVLLLWAVKVYRMRWMKWNFVVDWLCVKIKISAEFTRKNTMRFLRWRYFHHKSLSLPIFE